jgi:penicillin-binding protein 1A
MKLLLRIVAGLAALVGLGVAAAAGAIFLLYRSIVQDLPDLEGIEDYRPPLASTVTDRDGRPIGEFFEERRRLVRLSDLPQHVILAFVAGEDDSFFEHSGIDVRSILRAAWVNFTAGEIEQGASTITQQTVKSLLLTPERRFDRKLKEMILARRLEQHLTKDEILAIYLNQIYFGSGAWGIGEAARTYFGKAVGELTIGEGALLAGLPKAPSRFSPNANPRLAEERRRYVLGRMHELGFVTAEQYQNEVDNPPTITGPREMVDFPPAAWMVEEARRTLFERLGGETVLRGGLRIETTLDLRLQRSAEAALRAGLVALDHREGWHGPLRKVDVRVVGDEVRRLGAENQIVLEPGAAERSLERGRAYVGVVSAVDDEAGLARVALAPGVVGVVHLSDVSWARRRDFEHESVPRTRISQVFAPGDVARFELAPPPEEGTSTPEQAPPAPGELRLALHQIPEAEGALLALDVASGETLALVGGYDYRRSQFDRAVQARRQPGSAFKPFVYAAALQRGFTAVTTVYDTQVTYVDPSTGEVWRPANYDDKFKGAVPMREALARSLNNATIRILFDIGVSPVVRLAKQLGIRSHIAPYPSLALGTSPVTLLELTCAYAVFPAGGQRVTPVFIRRVLDRDGRTLLENVALESPPEDGTQHTESVRGAQEPPSVASPSVIGAREQVLDPAHAFLVTDLLRAPVEHPGGTARKAKVLERPIAGKTGTTNDQGDAWFVGFSADVAAGAWVGFDVRQVLGAKETGGRAALPIWIDFMKSAHLDRPVRDFPVPEGVSYARIDARTGQLAGEGSESSYFQSFLPGSEPKTKAGDGMSETDSRRLMRMDF